MHIPDGFLTARVWVPLDLAAAPAAAWLGRRAQRDFDHHKIPLMGVMGAFIFAAQMINFPVGNGTSGHLVGGALLSFTLGPAAASIVMIAILSIQALIFQDGGLLALGANVCNMAIAGVMAGYLPYILLKGRKSGIFLGGVLSLLTSALLALGELAVSGVPMPRAVLGVSLGLFVVSALVEGAITVAVVGALEKIQPGFLRSPTAGPGRGMVVLRSTAVVLAGAGIFLASDRPDGIENFARNTGIWSRATALFQTPLADYQLGFSGSHGTGSNWFGKTLAGLVGVILVYLVCRIAARLLARRKTEGA
jgi:cobalt/nickel transport system permease protein